VGFKQITVVDQLWDTSITLQKGFLYVVAIMGLHSRHVLSWKLSNNLDTVFCLGALQIALNGGRKPEILHSEKGHKFTSTDFMARLLAEEIKISCSRQKRCYDNIAVVRLWQILKHEEVNLHAYRDGGRPEV
jgi:putative transposase